MDVWIILKLLLFLFIWIYCCHLSVAYKLSSKIKTKTKTLNKVESQEKNTIAYPTESQKRKITVIIDYNNNSQFLTTAFTLFIMYF